VSRRVRPPAVEDADEGWLTTYADAITLLMTFFVMLFTLASTTDEEGKDAAMEAIASAFGAQPTAPSPAPDRTEGGDPSEAARAQVEEIVQEMGLRDEIKVESHDRGLRIEMASTVLYAPGQVELTGEAKRVVEQLAEVVAELAVEGTVVEVEGHTDDEPVRNATTPSAWELSSHRAGAVVRRLEAAGVPSKRLRVVGYGAALPVARNRTEAGEAIPSNQARNRRIAIVVKRP
jgi:chemotaxis protein MotB